MKNTFKFLTSAIAATGSLTLPFAVLAQNPFQQAQNLVGNVAQSANVGQQQELPVIVGRIINVILGFLGIILLVLVLYAGFLWMTAGGNEDQVKKAKQYITNSVIGLIVIVAAFAISNFVLNSLINVTQ
ncbi:hypothetical protein FBR07_04530 [Candidatus Uhrbacteria bacterium UHB]|nr:hypothetical protein [Candidatus Uhrbacteria bacterium UHB]RIL00084.1 MAG: hypothetical protein DCC77_05100 [Candidatus Uhrbacteria bacterium]